MKLLTNVKLGSVTNLTDARYAASAGFEFVGFQLSAYHPDYIEPQKVKEIMGWVEGVEFVAEFKDESPEHIYKMAEELKVAYIQLNRCDVQCSKELTAINIIQNFELTATNSFSTLIEEVDELQPYTNIYMLTISDLAFQEHCLSNPAERLMLLDFCRNYPTLLNFNFNKGNLMSVIKEFNPFGINIQGGVEEKPGLKDMDELVDMVELLEEH